MAACSVGTKNASVERDMQQSWMAAWRDDRSVTPRLERTRTIDHPRLGAKQLKLKPKTHIEGISIIGE